MDSNLQTLLAQGGINVAVTLARFGDNEALFLKFLRRFPTDSTFTTLTAALQCQSYDEIKAACHTLKGVSGNLGLTPLFEACSQMMVQLRADDLVDTSDTFATIQNAYRETIAMIAKLDA